MNPALWGLATALSWGSADFIARFTGRALGHQTALLGMLGASAVILSLIFWQADVPFIRDPSGWWLILLTGVGIMTATLLLYWGLVRGPVTVVAPIAASYPALNVALAVVLGARPSALDWAAMAAVMGGVIVVARAARSFEDPAGITRQQLRFTIALALGAALGFAVTIAVAQQASHLYGELQTVALSRWVSLLACALLLLVRRQAPRLPLRWWPWIGLQGLLDGGAYVALLAGSQGPGAEIAVVISSGFGAVTVLLARLVLREAMTWAQWAGIAAIVAGVAVLSGLH
ncbi:MAG: DMT family transporter [Alphaproteobacteria bacterium]